MSDRLAAKFGSALIWKGIQLVGVKVIFLARTLILARLLIPEDFGLLAISMIAVDVLLRITDFGMVPALVQKQDVEDQHYNAAWTVGIVRAVAVALIVFMAAPLIAELFSEPRATDLIRIVTIRPILEALVSIKVANLTRDLQFRSLAFIYLPEALANTLVSITLAPFWGVWALIAGALAGPVALIIASYIFAPHRPRLSFAMQPIRPLIQYGRWIFMTSLISVLGSSMVQLVISRQLGAAELGLYYLAAKLAFIPYEVGYEVVGAVAFPLFARLQSDLQKAARAFRSILTGISALLLPVCVLMIVLAPSLVENVLGSRWAGTDSIIRILTLVSVVELIGVTIAPALKGLGQPNRLVVIEISQSLLLITLIWWLTSLFGVNGAALAWLPAAVVAQTISIIFLVQVLPKPFAGLGLPMGIISFVSLLGGVIALLVNNALGGLIGFILASALALCVFGILLWLSDRHFELRLGEDLVQVFPQFTTLVRILSVNSKS